jgi:hypothetical protein
MIFQKGEVNYRPQTGWLGDGVGPYTRTLSAPLARALDLRTKAGQQFALVCELLAMDAGLLAKVKAFIGKKEGCP